MFAGQDITLHPPSAIGSPMGQAGFAVVAGAGAAVAGGEVACVRRVPDEPERRDVEPELEPDAGATCAVATLPPHEKLPPSTGKEGSSTWPKFFSFFRSSQGGDS